MIHVPDSYEFPYDDLNEHLEDSLAQFVVKSRKSPRLKCILSIEAPIGEQIFCITY